MSFYIKEKSFNGDGTEAKPFSDIQELFEIKGAVEVSKILIHNAENKYDPISQSAYKKGIKYFYVNDTFLSATI